jgi:cob(I)alamin adenosyltransferase
MMPPEQTPRVHVVRKGRREPSLVVVHTGDGKGKTTAAMGIVLRACGHGWPVAVVQFMKSGRWKVGEEKAARRLGVDWWTVGDGFTWESDDLTRSEGVAIEAWRAASEIIVAGRHQLVVLDEVTYPMNWGWIATTEVIAAIRARPRDVSIVATGRDAPAELLAIADTASESVVVRHAYETGISALRGVDF